VWQPYLHPHPNSSRENFKTLNKSSSSTCIAILAMRTNSSYWYWIYFWFCPQRLFSEDFYLANDHGTIRQHVFIAIAAWWLSHFSPDSRRNSLLFRSEQISSLTSLLQIICIRMQCWLDDRVYFICQDSIQAISEEGQRGRKRKKNIEILSHQHQRGIEEGACESHFIVFSDRWV
jgi:hypothetical protein